MSNVHQRFRKETELKFLMSAQELQIDLTKFIMSEKNMPKKWRYMIGQSTIAKVDELLDNLEAGNAIFPTNKSEYNRRANFQEKAIGNCWQLHNKIVRMIFCIDNAKVEKLEKIIELLSNVEGLIKKWEKNDKARYKDLPKE